MPATLGYVIATPLPFRDAWRHAGDLRFRVAGGAYQPNALKSIDLHLHLNTVGKCVSNLETLIGCSALFMANAAILISNSAKIMTVMVMIMMASGNGATVLRVVATTLAAVAMVMACS